MATSTVQTPPYITVTGVPPRFVYQSIDAIDEVLYNDLGGTPPVTGADIRMRWNKKKKHLIKIWTKGRPRHAAARTAVPPPPALPPRPRPQAQHHLGHAHGQTQEQTEDQTGDPTAVTHTASAVTPSNDHQSLSPTQSPLAELSPRFLCQAEWPDHLLSPTRGQSNAIAKDLQGNWKYGGVAYQETLPPGLHVSVVPLRSVYLYVRSDDTGTIQEQVAVKCLEIDEMTEQTYEEQSRQSLGLEIDKSSIYESYEQDSMNEIDICRRIGLTHCSHMTQYRGYGVRDLMHTILQPGETGTEAIGQKTVHLYQSWASRGDLENLIRQHRLLRRPINEHFIWYTLRELTEALIALKYGPGSCTSARAQLIDIPEGAEPALDSSEPWVPILHLDMKPDNVLLENPGENAEYPAYPKPVLCDFGLSQLATDEFLHGTSVDVLDRRFSGTKGWLPPERSSSAEYDLTVGTVINEGYRPHYWPLSEKTDVWGLGLIAQKMMFAHHRILIETRTLSNVDDWEEDLRDLENLQDSHYEPSLHLGPGDYSISLHIFAVDCLRHDMNERPDLLELRKRTNAGLTRLEGLYGENIKKRKRDPEDALNIITCDKEGHLFEKFEIGKKYQPERKVPRLELDEYGLDHFEYGKFVSTWDGMDPKPTIAVQDIIAERIGFHLSHALEVRGIDDRKAKSWEWSSKYLVSCLRKRILTNPTCYVLTHQEIVEQKGMIRDASKSIEAFEIDIKLEVLEYLRDEPSLQADRQVVATGASSVIFLKHVVEWALFFVSKCHEENRIFEPKCRGQELQDLSDLHQGFFDWIFVKPSGAFVRS